MVACRTQPIVSYYDQLFVDFGVAAGAFVSDFVSAFDSDFLSDFPSALLSAFESESLLAELLFEA